MSAINLNIDPKEVEQAVAQAVLASSLGTILQEVIKEKSMDSGYGRNTFKDAISRKVDSIVMEAVANHIQMNHAEKIKQMIAGYMTDQVLSELIKKAWDTLMGKINDRY